MSTLHKYPFVIPIKVGDKVEVRDQRFVAETASKAGCMGCYAHGREDWLCSDLPECDGVIFKKVDSSEPVTSPAEQVVEKSPQPKKLDQGKLRYDLIPAEALQEVVRALTFGETKYPSVGGIQNWRLVENRGDRYFAACQRHTWAVKMNERYDSDSKCHHYAAAIVNLMFLLQEELEKDKELT